MENNGRVAIQRGPLVYCMEQIDQPQGVALTSVALNATGDGAAKFDERFERDLLGGILVLRHPGAVYESSPQRSSLYFAHSASPSKSRPTTLTFIPYYAWANRTPTSMQVWTPVMKA